MKLASGSQSDATVFLIEGIPDCRQVLDPDFPPGLVQTCADANAVVTLPGAPQDPAAQLLNLTALFPFEILSLFDSSGVPPAGLPPLYVSRQYRGQRQNNFLFNAFFYVTEPGVHFQDNFTAEYDVPVLEGEGSLGCVPDPANLIAWDIITNVSELYLSADGNGDNLPSYVDTLTNTGCINPTKTFQTRISAVPYNLEVNPDTYGPIFGTTLKDVTPGNDAVFARLIQSLYDDLEFVRRELACKLVDAAAASRQSHPTSATRWPASGRTARSSSTSASTRPSSPSRVPRTRIASRSSVS